jgi:hypothetical protein
MNNKLTAVLMITAAVLTNAGVTLAHRTPVPSAAVRTVTS